MGRSPRGVSEGLETVHEGDDLSSLWITVLGPLQLTVDGRHVAVPGEKRRATLAMLAMAAPGPISTEQLVDALWPDEAPQSGRAALQSHISRIRRHLGAHGSRLTSTEGGYRLGLRPDELDARRFADLVRGARATADPHHACEDLLAATGLWRGQPLGDLFEVAPLAAWSQALTEAWIDASDLLVNRSLEAGDTATAVAAATAVMAADPLREATTVLLVQALAADGRAAEALRAAHRFRVRLGEETGLEPSRALAEVEQAVAAGQLGPVRGARHDSPVPTPTTALLGRQAELAGLRRLIADERLVTVIGPGGVGKTHLALEAARQATPDHDEVHLLRLAPVVDTAALPTVLEGALGLDPSMGVDDPVARCAFRLRSGRQLLVVDCCEHLLDAARTLVESLLESCPDLTVLATSRERLALPVEQTCRLGPLPMPRPATGSLQDDVRPEQIPSVALFLERARRARPELGLGDLDLATVSRIVRRLDGMPLAIELAAGRLASLALADLETRLDRALDLLGSTPATIGRTSGPPTAADRHRTLRAALQWSYDLLPAEEQMLFRNLATFPDGVDLATAEQLGTGLGLAVDPAIALAHLVDASMVEADLTGPTRYRMLDTLRAFGLDRLEAAGEAEAATERLVAWARNLTSWLWTTSMTDDEPLADQRLRTELANLRAAWRTARERSDLDSACAMVVDLNDVVAWRDVTEVWGWARELGDDAALVGHPMESAALGVAAEAAWFSTGDLDRAEALATRAMGMLDGADARASMVVRWAMADVYMFRGRFDDARRLALEARQESRVRAEGHGMAALIETYAGQLEAAEQHLALATQAPASPTIRAFLRYVEGELAGRRADWDQAEAAYRDAIGAAGRTGARFLEGVASVGLVSALVARGRTAEALDGYRDLIDRWERTGGWTQQWTTLRNVADLLEALRDIDSAEIIREAADRAPEASALRPDVPPRTDKPGDPVDRERILALARTAIDRARRGLAPV